MNEDTKIYLMLGEFETDTQDNPQELVSHGVGNNTLKTYCLPVEPAHWFHPKVDSTGYYIDA